ncbi:MAG: RluA family pseudouridine synthase [Holosporaceae bacterium]|nr:RluA family pseudouridine synthase [Holosporaceae bacterium]
MITENSCGSRLDKFLTSEIGSMSRSKIQLLISSGRVQVNDKQLLDPNYRLKSGDKIFCDDNLVISKPDLTPDATVAFSILHEDEDLLVIDKPAGIVVHPGAGNYRHTLVNGLAHHCGQSLSSGSDEFRPGIVHRLDKDTSGILVVAKNDFTHTELAGQFATHSITRKYICFCHSILRFPQGKIETLISRDRKNRLKMCVSGDRGKAAITLYRTLQTFSGIASKVECELKTGRTHQIRLHMSHMGHALIGDSLYKTKNYASPQEIYHYINKFPRQALHAYFLKFSHPRSGKFMRFETSLPTDMLELEDRLQNLSP